MFFFHDLFTYVLLSDFILTRFLLRMTSFGVGDFGFEKFVDICSISYVSSSLAEPTEVELSNIRRVRLVLLLKPTLLFKTFLWFTYKSFDKRRRGLVTSGMAKVLIGLRFVGDMFVGDWSPLLT